jgi:hypothetical protein
MAIAAIAMLAVVVLRFSTSWQDVHHDGGADLRPKVVGARAMLAGQNPYRLPPNSQLPESLRDADRLADPLASRVSYPPTLLAVYGIFAALRYPVQRLIWFGLEWAALLASILILATVIADRNIRLAFIGMCLVFAVGAPGWRLHVERGQYYVFLLLLIAIAARRLVARSSDDWLAGVCLGFAVALRPTLIVIPVLLGLLRWRRTAITSVAVAGVCMLLTLPMAPIPVWRDYVGVVRRQQDAVLLGQPVSIVPAERRGNTFIDGADFRASLDSRTANLTSVHALGAFLRHQFSRSALMAINSSLALVVVASSAAFLWTRRARLSGAAAMAGSLVTAFLVEYFLPIRWGYADVYLIVPLALLAPYLWQRRALLIGAGTAMVVGEFVVSSGLISATVITLAWWSILLAGYRLALSADERQRV